MFYTTLHIEQRSHLHKTTNWKGIGSCSIFGGLGQSRKGANVEEQKEKLSLMAIIRISITSECIPRPGYSLGIKFIHALGNISSGNFIS